MLATPVDGNGLPWHVGRFPYRLSMDTPGGVEPPAGRVAACPVLGTADGSGVMKNGCWSGMPTVWIRSVTRGPVARSRSDLGTTRLETVLVRTRSVPAAAKKEACVRSAKPTKPLHAKGPAPKARSLGESPDAAPQQGVDKVGIEPTASRVQTGRSSAELPAHDPPRARGGDDVLLRLWMGWGVGLPTSRRGSACASRWATTRWFSKTPGKRRTPAGEAGVRECAGRTWS